MSSDQHRLGMEWRTCKGLARQISSRAARWRAPKAALGQRHALAHVHAGAAQQVFDGAFVQAGGVVFDANGALPFVELQAADSVHVVHFAQRAHLFFAWRHSVAEHHFQHGHRFRLSQTYNNKDSGTWATVFAAAASEATIE